MVDPSKLSREVKGLVADFREELKLRDPWDREIDIQFKRIQRKYKDILFDFPFSRQAHSVDQALWTDTSYALITRYRSRIDPVRSSPANNKNVVENRKILQKFLAFLASEGAFWSGIVSRLVRVHGLTEANNALAALEMNVIEFENRETLARREAIGSSTSPIDEIIAPSHPPTTEEQRSNKLLTVFRALIYLGDLARYREQYGTHPNKNNPDAGSKRSRGGRRGRDKGSDRSHEKPYAKAEAFYVQARLLLPDYGNPFNQLAIVYANQHDYFEAALNYYRALCVRKPFPTAQDNLVRSLSKCLEVDRDLWRTRRAQEADGNVDGDPETERGGGKGKNRNGKALVDIDGSKDLESKFKQDVVLLHALWTGKCRPTKLARHTHNVLASFASLIARRLLPTVTIVHVLVLTLGALWKFRMFKQDDKPRLQSRRSKGKARDDEPDEDVPLESTITAHLLSLCTILLEIGTREIQEGVREVVEAGGQDVEDTNRLAQRITGTFRRTLPALRIATKWIKGNAKYIQQYSTESPAEDDLSVLRPNVASFWQAWASFETLLAAVFPLDLLPPSTAPLEEDIDMKGFSPLKWSFTGSKDGTDGAKVDAASVHPNEEQLMRIRDLIVDGKYTAGLPESPVSAAGQDFVFDAQQSGQSVKCRARFENWEQRAAGHSDDGSGSDHVQEPLDDGDDLPHPDDDRATVSTRTEDDPVRLAMDAVLTEDEDDDEQILYPQRYTHRQVNVSVSPPESPSPLAQPGALPVWQPPTPSFLSSGSNNHATQLDQTSLPKRAGTTAEDLLNRVLKGTPTFLNMSSVSGSGPSSAITPATPFVGRTMSVPGPTPSFLVQSRQSPPFTTYPPQSPQHNAFGQQSNQDMPVSSPFPSFSSSPSSFSGTNSTNPFPSLPPYSGGRLNEPLSTFFHSHTRVASLSGATSIWTPAPQEVSGSPQLGGSSRVGSMRANSVSGNIMHPNAEVQYGPNAWPARAHVSREVLAPKDFVGMARQRTYTNPGRATGRG